MESRHPGPAVFLDRDGVINRDSPDYVTSVAQVRFVPGSLEAIARLCARGIAVVVVTNQSAVGRGMIGEPELAAIHDHVRAAVAGAGGRLLDVLHCPHLPGTGCRCRKPAPGMVEDACRRHGIDPSRSAFVGDRAKDIECARNAGCGRAILVLSGPEDPSAELAAKGIRPDHTAADLAGAVDWLLADRFP
jgi:histidinol-phosphate phosphatase family protein